MLTLFAVPKPFVGHTGIIQRNAVISWTLLRPRPEIILFGKDLGTEEISREFGLRHLPELATTELGAPLLPDLFQKAERTARFDVLAYVNCDIMLFSDFNLALGKIAAEKRKFLMVGNRFDLPIAAPLDFSRPQWESALLEYVRQSGVRIPPPGNSDYFAFPRGLWREIIPIALGRARVDPWLVYEARRIGAAVVDATDVVVAIHQNHDQSASLSRIRQWHKENNLNRQLVGKEKGKFCLWDVTHLLTPRGLVRPYGLRYLIRRVDTLHLFYPRVAAPLNILRRAADRARTFIRERELARNPLLRLITLVQAKTRPDGICAILGLEGGRQQQGGDVSGLQLAYGLCRVGAPITVYDPMEKTMEKARQLLGGPVKFAASAKECVSEADVIVLTALDNELRQVQFAATSSDERPCVVIDCCGSWPQAAAQPEIEYIAWTK